MYGGFLGLRIHNGNLTVGSDLDGTVGFFHTHHRNGIIDYNYNLFFIVVARGGIFRDIQGSDRSIYHNATAIDSHRSHLHAQFNHQSGKGCGEGGAGILTGQDVNRTAGKVTGKLSHRRVTFSHHVDEARLLGTVMCIIRNGVVALVSNLGEIQDHDTLFIHIGRERDGSAAFFHPNIGRTAGALGHKDHILVGIFRMLEQGTFERKALRINPEALFSRFFKSKGYALRESLGQDYNKVLLPHLQRFSFRCTKRNGLLPGIDYGS